MTAIALSPRFSPLDLQARSLRWQVAAVLVGSALLAVASQIKVPMVPVPMTMQTFAVTLIGALYGWRLGAITILAWLAQGAMGLPVLAGGAAGLLHFAGPTGGYLVAFPIAGAVTGWLAERGWNGNAPGALLRRDAPGQRALPRHRRRLAGADDRRAEGARGRRPALPAWGCAQIRACGCDAGSPVATRLAGTRLTRRRLRRAHRNPDRLSRLSPDEKSGDNRESSLEQNGNIIDSGAIGR